MNYDSLYSRKLCTLDAILCKHIPRGHSGLVSKPIADESLQCFCCILLNHRGGVEGGKGGPLRRTQGPQRFRQLIRR